jgi:hypothetical protein
MKTVGPVVKRRERDIQRAILDLLHARGVVCWKAGSGGFRVTDTHGRERYVKMGHTGVADIIGLLPGTGRFCAVEVKQPGKDATPEQATFLASVRHEVAKELGWT